MLLRFKVKHRKGLETYFASDELDAFKKAHAQGLEDIIEIQEWANTSPRRSPSKKWIIGPEWSKR
jgi:hypothetical protein